MSDLCGVWLVGRLTDARSEESSVMSRDDAVGLGSARGDSKRLELLPRLREAILAIH
jgi:hypothetical protein